MHTTALPGRSRATRAHSGSWIPARLVAGGGPECMRRCSPTQVRAWMYEPPRCRSCRVPSSTKASGVLADPALSQDANGRVSALAQSVGASGTVNDCPVAPLIVPRADSDRVEYPRPRDLAHTQGKEITGGVLATVAIDQDSRNPDGQPQRPQDANHDDGRCGFVRQAIDGEPIKSAHIHSDSWVRMPGARKDRAMCHLSRNNCRFADSPKRRAGVRSEGCYMSGNGPHPTSKASATSSLRSSAS